MPRPTRKTSEAFYDVFSDMPIEDQTVALRILEQVHRMAKRDKPAAAKDPDAPEGQEALKLREANQ